MFWGARARRLPAEELLLLVAGGKAVAELVPLLVRHVPEDFRVDELLVLLLEGRERGVVGVGLALCVDPRGLVFLFLVGLVVTGFFG